MGEVCVISVRASVIVYDDVSKKWVPGGHSQGLSKVQIYQHMEKNTFRVVGRKLQDHEVVINCAITKGMMYKVASATFHQWRDNRQVYGLNFTNADDADNFYHSMQSVLQMLEHNVQRNPMSGTLPISQSPVQYPGYAQPGPNLVQETAVNISHCVTDSDGCPQNNNYGHRRQISSGSGLSESVQPSSSVPMAQYNHLSSAVSMPANVSAMAEPNNTPPVQPVPFSGCAPPPAPPPPPPASKGLAAFCVKTGNADTGGVSTDVLAAALQSAHLRKVEAKQQDESGSGGGECGTLGRANNSGSGGMVDMMSEMQKKLAIRRAKASNTGMQDSETSNTNASMLATPDPRRQWEKQPANNSGQHINGSQSPKCARKQNPSSTGQEVLAPVNGGGGDFDNLKQELLSEIRMEMQRMKMEIVDAIRQEFGHR